MKKIIAAFFVATFCLTSCSEDDITGIVKHCTQINAHLNDYKKKDIDLTGITSEGGTITGYFKDKELVMASVSSFGQASRSVSEYFFDDDKLECVIQQEYTYNRPMYYTDTMAIEDGDTAVHGGYDDKKTVMKVTRFYFYDGRMIKWFDEHDKLIPDNDRKYEFQTHSLLTDADKLSKMLKAQ